MLDFGQKIAEEPPDVVLRDPRVAEAYLGRAFVQRIRAVLKVVAPDKLWLNPDCGFWETPRWVVKQKLAALVEGARMVRKELGG